MNQLLVIMIEGDMYAYFYNATIINVIDKVSTFCG